MNGGIQVMDKKIHQVVLAVVAASFLAAFVLPARMANAVGRDGEITYGVEYSNKDEDNAKFHEYNYNRTQRAGLSVSLRKDIDLTVEDAAKKRRDLGWLGIRGAEYLDVDMSAISPAEGGFQLTTGSYGQYKLTFGVQSMGHNFYYNARSLYAGNGSGTLTMLDAIQTDIQNSATAVRDDKLRTYLATSGNDVDLSLHRDKVRLNFERQSPTRPVTWNLFADQEYRKGSRPYGGSFGHGSAVEIPEPIDYGTLNFGGGAEYVTKTLYATAKLTRSRFRNEYTGVKFDNPLIVTDSTAAAAGQDALPPDNTCDNVSLFASKSMLDEHHTRISARASLARMRQSDNLLPMSNNTYYDTAVPSYTKLTTTKGGLRVDKKQYGVDLSSNLTEKFRVKTSFQYDQHKNRSPNFTTPKYLAYDGSMGTGGETTTYVSYIKRVTEVEAEYEISKNAEASFTFEHEVASFRNGSANHERENGYEFGLIRHGERYTGRLVAKHANKTSDYPSYVKWQGELPLMRKYYAASLEQNQLTAMLTANPVEKLAMNLEYLYGRDKYPQSTYGRKFSRHNLIGVDADFQFDDRTSVSAFYSFEITKTLQQSHNWSAGNPADPHAYPDTYIHTADWTLGRRDRWRTLGMTVSSTIVENILDVVISGSISSMDGLADYDSTGASRPPNDFQQVDESRMRNVDAHLNYRMRNKPGVVTLGYRYDNWRISDFQYDGVQEVTESSTGSYLGLLTMNTLPKPYGGVHTVYLTVTRPF